MTTVLKRGSTVTVNAKPVTGTIEETRFNEDAQELAYHIKFTNAAGEEHMRWFLQSELEDSKGLEGGSIASNSKEQA